MSWLTIKKGKRTNWYVEITMNGGRYLYSLVLVECIMDDGTTWVYLMCYL